jgi:hypothetical protein
MSPPKMQFLLSEYTYFGIAFGVILGSRAGPPTGSLLDGPEILFAFFFIFGLVLLAIGKLGAKKD